MKILPLILFFAPSLTAQEIVVSTAGEQYATNSVLADSIALTTKEFAYQLGLFEWRIFLHFESLDTEEKNILASSRVVLPYLVAHISVDLPDFEEMSQGSIEETMRHELMHIVLWEYISYIRMLLPTDSSSWILLRDLTEKITTRLTRMPLWAARN